MGENYQDGKYELSVSLFVTVGIVFENEPTYCSFLDILKKKKKTKSIVLLFKTNKLKRMHSFQFSNEQTKTNAFVPNFKTNRLKRTNSFQF